MRHTTGLQINHTTTDRLNTELCDSGRDLVQINDNGRHAIPACGCAPRLQAGISGV
ncbi:hypothetical protein BRAS3843_140002 [Bradyrhizobium sp. STM 3843]|nr:hypothetical protein BRAS3843_140002 [Bradyrhizobium sp. STM 3843]